MSGSLFSSLLVRSNQFGRLAVCRQCVLTSRLLPGFANYAMQYCRSSQKQGADSTSVGGLWSKIKFDFGFITGLKYSRSVLNVAGFRMYVCCTEMIDHQQFFKEFKLPDTFYSWFLVTNLHIWLCMVRLASLEKDGRVLRNCLIKALWDDIESRSKQLGSAATSAVRREGIQAIADVFHASLYEFDEGLLGGDKDLAGALWRVFFEMRDDVDPTHLELLVAYVRKQVAHIDRQNGEDILKRGDITFLPLRGEKVDSDFVQRKKASLGLSRSQV